MSVYLGQLGQSWKLEEDIEWNFQFCTKSYLPLRYFLVENKMYWINLLYEYYENIFFYFSMKLSTFQWNFYRIAT